MKSKDWYIASSVSLFCQCDLNPKTSMSANCSWKGTSPSVGPHDSHRGVFPKAGLNSRVNLGCQCNGLDRKSSTIAVCSKDEVDKGPVAF